MHKKIITLFLFIAFFTFNVNINVKASFPTESFQVDFNAVLTPNQQLVGTELYYQFDSECIDIPDNINVISIQSLSNPNNINTTKYRHPNDMHTSRINYFVNTDCDTANFSSHAVEDRFFEFNNNIGLLGDKPYVFNIGNIANHFNIPNFTPVRSKSFNISFASNIELPFLIAMNQAGDPFEDQLAVSTFITFSTPNIVRYVDGFNVTDRYFIGTLPVNPTPTRTNYTFQYWRDINGNRQFGQSAVNDTSLISVNGVYSLFAYYTRDVVAGDPILDTTLGGVLAPLDTILFNTGFLNNGGVMLLYFILVICISFLAFHLKLNSLISIIINVLLTAMFLILGYLPLFTSVLLITFYIIALISINKGGFLNE